MFTDSLQVQVGLLGRLVGHWAGMLEGPGYWVGVKGTR